MRTTNYPPLMCQQLYGTRGLLRSSYIGELVLLFVLQIIIIVAVRHWQILVVGLKPESEKTANISNKEQQQLLI